MIIIKRLMKIILFPIYVMYITFRLARKNKQQMDKQSIELENIKQMLQIVTNKFDETQLSSNREPYKKGNFNWDYSLIKKELPHFLDMYKQSPIKKNTYGMKTPHAFATYFILKALNPKIVIESGIYKGFSTWLIKQTLPKAKIISFDIDLSIREYKSAEVEYHDFDLTEYDWSTIPNKEDCVVFLDDHQNYFERIQFLHSQGFVHCIVEDNYPQYFGDCYTIKQIVDSIHHPHDKIIIENLLEIYREFPPVITKQVTRFDEFHTGLKSVWNIPTEKPVYVKANEGISIFEQEYDRYGFIAYLKLIQK